MKRIRLGFDHLNATHYERNPKFPWYNDREIGWKKQGPLENFWCSMTPKDGVLWPIECFKTVSNERGSI